MFQSSLTTAQKNATRLSGAAQKLKEKQNGQTDNRTTLQGNQEAQTNFKQTQNIVSSYSQALEKTIETIHQVANEFEAMDQSLSQKIDF